MHSLRGVRFKHEKSVFIGSQVVIDNRCPELISIGRDVWLTVGTKVLAHSFRSEYQSSNLGFREKQSEIIIEDGVFVGAGSTILARVTIGRGAYIAAGSVVTRDVESHTLVAGNPARPIKKLRLNN